MRPRSSSNEASTSAARLPVRPSVTPPRSPPPSVSASGTAAGNAHSRRLRPFGARSRRVLRTLGLPSGYHRLLFEVEEYHLADEWAEAVRDILGVSEQAALQIANAMLLDSPPPPDEDQEDSNGE